MKRFLGMISMTLLVCGLIAGSGCILQKKIVELVLTDETFADFAELDSSASWTHPDTLDNYASDLDQALADAGYSRSDITSATLMAGHYGVLKTYNAHDWQLAGSITVQRLNPPGAAATIIDYSNVSVDGSLGRKIPAPLISAGVAVMNQALTDFINGQNPVLVFTVVNGSVSPIPTQIDPIQFDWRAWITIQVLLEADVEVPDPF